MEKDDRIGPMMTVREVAQLLHLHTNTVRRWADQGIIRAYRITRRGDRRFRQEDIVRFLAGLSTKGSNREKINSNQR